MLGYRTVQEFKQCWNSIPKDIKIDKLVIIAHGSSGTIDCAKEQIGLYNSGKYPLLNANELERINVTETILLSCNGATPGKNDISAAYWISERTGSNVYAAYRLKVNYFSGTGYPYGVPDTENGFISSLRSIFGGCWRWTHYNE